MAAKITALDIFNQLTPAEKRKALKVLQQAEQTPCARLGHSYKKSDIVGGWFTEIKTKYVCSRCGDTFLA
jgi:hypothetical protein